MMDSRCRLESAHRERGSFSILFSSKRNSRSAVMVSIIAGRASSRLRVKSKRVIRGPSLGSKTSSGIVYIYIDMCRYIRLVSSIYMYVRICIYMCICIYECMYICIYV